ncbi:hypothetical protein FPZ43_00095 [Mucilaginibacter pallidiroseus]|uniref:Uncharacterized protein n=1 Tax=Mucilaginibacter pallidiroseus TaxID=2599295 RepID=A0A563UI17_9SPHI|nr:hypothetical protein [Mucilaginibacter pallidiroseus]TWR30919.1 hypothetical protein FPZ43_00095 [Mucilaginibacter pallidiroseus]
MKKSIAILYLLVSIAFAACDDTSTSAVGTNDKPDSAVFDSADNGVGRPEETKEDTSANNVGPGSEKTHAIDSEHKQKH